MKRRFILIACLFVTFAGASPQPQRATLPRKKWLPVAETQNRAQTKEADGESKTSERTTKHFRFLYDPAGLTLAQVDEAAREAEASFVEIAKLFPNVEYTEKIIIRLDARFRGATGYAAPGGKSGKGKQDVIGLRYEDLPTLGLTPAFLFRHELTHLFVGRWEDGQPSRNLSGSALGEGIADMTAGGRNRLGLPLSFVKYLQRQNAWVSPERLFLHPPGGAPPTPKNGRLEYEQVFRWRITRYVEPSLLLQFAQSKVGWGKMRQFYIDYARASQSRNAPDNIRTVFRRHFGQLPEEFFAEWQAEIDKAPEDQDDRLRWMSERAYAAVQWYEFLIAGKQIPESKWPEIDAQFRTLHADVAARRLDAAEKGLHAVLDRVEEAVSGDTMQINSVRRRSTVSLCFPTEIY